jgi:hypothetical protein
VPLATATPVRTTCYGAEYQVGLCRCSDPVGGRGSPSLLTAILSRSLSSQIIAGVSGSMAF